MEDEKIIETTMVLNISSNVDEICNRVKSMKNDVEGIRADFSAMPNLSGMLNNNLERTVGLANDVEQKFKAIENVASDSDEYQNLAHRTTQNALDLQARHSLQNGTSEFSVQYAKSFVDSLPIAIAQAMDRVAPAVANVINSRMSSFAKNASLSSAFKRANDLSSFSHAMLHDRDIKSIISHAGVTASDEDLRKYFEIVAANVVPMYQLNEYSRLRYNQTVNRDNLRMLEDPIAQLPNSFKQSFKDKHYVRRNVSSDRINESLSTESIRILRGLLEHNPIAVRAAVSSGIARRDPRGTLELREQISHDQYEDFRNSLWSEFVSRATGINEYRIDDIFDKKHAKTLAKRMAGSSSAGKTVQAMNELERLEENFAWAIGNEKYGSYAKIRNEEKRSRDLYGIKRFNLFDPNQRPVKDVVITESANTRLLGLQHRGHNADASDTVAYISLAGIDENNKTHTQKLNDIMQKGIELPTASGEMVHFSFQGMKRDDDGARLTMVATSAMKAVDDKLAPIAKSLGLTGSYWENYQKTDHFDSEVDYRKHLDARNKGWTPSSEIGNLLSGKRVAVVNFEDVQQDGTKVNYNDGIGWIPGLQHPIQFRGGVALKGTLRPLPGENNRDFAIRSGLASMDEQGNYHWYVNGANKDDGLFDIIDYDGFVDASVIKNMSAYSKDGVMRSNAEISELFTSMFDINQLAEARNFDLADTESDALGVQMMTYMKMSPAIILNQLRGFKKRMQELGTEAGIRKYIFPLGNDDALSKAINTPGNERLIQSDEVKTRVDAYINELSRQIRVGEYVDFGDDESTSISYKELSGSPLVGMWRKQGLSAETKDFAKKALKAGLKMSDEEFSKEYSDEVLESILLLKQGNVIDFLHQDKRKEAFLRSPTGFGDYLVAINRAKEWRILQQAFAGNVPEGVDPKMFSKEFLEMGNVILGPEDLLTLSGADLDADAVKIATGDEVIQMVEDSVAWYNSVRDRFGDIGDLNRTSTAKTNVSDSVEYRSDAAVALAKEVLAMGAAAGSTSRAHQLDLTDPLNNLFAVTSIRGRQEYDAATTDWKKPGVVEHKDGYYETLKIGREYTRFVDNLDSLFRYDDDMIDAKTQQLIMGHKDLYFDESGQVINLRALRGPLNLLKTNLPSVNMDNHMRSVIASSELYRSGMVDSTRADAIEHALEFGFDQIYTEEEFGKLGDKTKTFIKMMDKMYPQFATGKRSKATEQETAALKTANLEFQREIEEIVDAKQKEQGLEGTGNVYDDRGKLVGRNKLVDDYLYKLGHGRYVNFVDKFGFTEENIDGALNRSEKYAALSSYFQNSEDASIVLTPNGSSSNQSKIVVAPNETPENTINASNANKTQVSSTNVATNSTDNQDTSVSDRDASVNFANNQIKPYDGSNSNYSNNNFYNNNFYNNRFHDGEQVDVQYQPPAHNDSQPGTSESNSFIDYNGVAAPEEYSFSYADDGNIDPYATLLDDMFKKHATSDQIKAVGQTLLADMLATSGQFYGDRFKNREQTSAEKYFGISNGKRAKQQDAYRDLKEMFEKNGDIKTSPLWSQINRAYNSMNENYYSGTRDWSKNTGSKFLENLKQAVAGVGDEFDKQIDQIEGYKEAINELQSVFDQFKKSREKTGLLPEDHDVLKTLGDQIDEAKKVASEGAEKIRIKNNESALQRAAALENQIYKKSGTARQKAEIEVSRAKEAAQKELDWLESGRNKKLIDEDAYNEAKKQNEASMEYIQNRMLDDLLEKSREQETARVSRLVDSSDNYIRRLMHQRHRPASRWEQRAFEFSEQRRQLQEYTSSLKTSLDDKRAELATAKSNKNSTTEEIKALESDVNRLSEAYKNNQRAAEELNFINDELAAGLSVLDESVNRVVSQFGRQMFHLAINETKRFVMEYNSAMTEIQSITLMTNDNLNRVGDTIVGQAIDLKTPISNVASVTAELYRQGLDDNEVKTRTENIVKFAKVAKIKTEEATKIITTALSNNLVSSAESAMDALVALGDNAATTASEIAKGMQRSAASAKVAGVSYEELTAMLTIGTSMTQLSGAQIGTAYKTIFSRMRSITSEKYAADQSGEITSANEVEAALQTANISLRNKDGTFRDVFDILLDISKVWETLSDMQKSVITQAVAASRQANIFQTLMEGMADDGGKTLEKYLGLASGSEGVTQSKYEIAASSITASIDTMRASFDSLIATVESAGAITGFFNIVSDLFQSLSGHNGGLAQNISSIGALTAAIAALAMLFVSGPASALLTGSAILFGAGMLSSSNKNDSEDVRNRQNVQMRTNVIRASSDDISSLQNNRHEIEKLNNRYQELSEAEQSAALSQNEYTSAIKKALHGVDDLSSYINENTGYIVNWNAAMQTSLDRIDELERKSRTRILGNSKDNFAQNYESSANEYDSMTSALNADLGAYTTRSVKPASVLGIDVETVLSRPAQDAFRELVIAGYNHRMLDDNQRSILFGTVDSDRIETHDLVSKLLIENFGSVDAAPDYNADKDDSKLKIEYAIQPIYSDNGNSLADWSLVTILNDLSDSDPGYKYSHSQVISDMYSSYLQPGTPEYETMVDKFGFTSFNNPNDPFSVVSQWKSKNFDTNNDAYWFLTDLYGSISSSTPSLDDKERISENTVNEAIASIEGLDSMLLSEGFSQEEKDAVTNLLKEYLTRGDRLYDETNGAQGVDLGSVSSVKDYLYDGIGRLVEVRNNEGSINRLLSDDEFKYFINGTDGNRHRFFNKDDVEQFVQDSEGSYTLSSVFDKDGNRVYTNDGDLIAYGMKYRSENNAYRPEVDKFIDDILASGGIKEGGDQYDKSLPKILSQVPDLAPLYELVSRTESGNLNEGEHGMTLEQFKNIAQYYKTGKTPDLGYVDSYASYMIATQERAYDLMTNPSLTGLYEQSQAVLGDAFTNLVKAVANNSATAADVQDYRQARYSVAVDDLDIDEETAKTILSLKGFFGSTAEQMSSSLSFMSMMDSSSKAEKAWAGIQYGNLTEANISTLADYLSMNDDQLKELLRTESGKAEITKRFDATKKIASDTIAQSIESLIKARGLDFGTLDLDNESLAAKLSEFISEWLGAEIENYDITVKGGKISVDNFESESIDAETRMNAEYATRDSDNNHYTILKALSDAVFADGRSDAGQSILNYVTSTNANITDDDLSRFYASNPRIHNMLRANSIGELSDEDLSYYLKSELAYGSENDSGYYDIGLKMLLGEDYAKGDFDATSVLDKYSQMNSSLWGQDMLEELSKLESFPELLETIADGFKTGNINQDEFIEGLKRVNDEMSSKRTAEHLKYNRAMQKTVDTLTAIRAGGEDAANAYNDLYEQTQNLANANWALNQYKTGNRSDDVVSVLGKQFKIDEHDLKKASKEQAALYYSTMSDAYEAQAGQLETNLNANINDVLRGYMAQLPEGHDIDLGKFVVGGVVDVGGLTKAFAESDVIVSSAWSSLISALSSLGATFTVGADGNTIQVDTTDVTKKSYGGGGGSKKSSADKLVERLGHGQSLYEHQIKMVQYEQTKYENADELRNYSKMLEEEIKIERAYLPVLESNIAALRSELGSVKEGSEDWYKLRDAILEAEEQFADINNTIDENEKKLKENHQAILKLHTDLEEMVVGEIELRIDAEKEMLDGSVSMQDTILSAIKQRYQDEWDLIKQDIEKKKEALQQEKDLIDERLDARRDAEDEAAKYEELAELKKQLSLVSMDSTRTKDAAALRESIAELEKEIGWDIAEREAENEKNAIQDQIDAYDDYVTKGDEDLETLLEDANNFSEEVNSVLKLNQSELFEWLKQNVKEYANSLDDAQKQMVQSWEATYKQMLGITDTYWDEVNAILSSKDTFLNYMKQSNEYIYASDDERAQLLYQWEEAYDKWMKSKKNDADYSHGDNGLGDWSGSEYTGGSSSGSGSGSGGSSSSDNKYTGTPGQNGYSGTQYADTNYKMEFSTESGAPLTSYNDNLEQIKVSAADASKKQPGKPVLIYGPDGKLLYKYLNGQAIVVGNVNQHSGNSSTSGMPETGWPSSSPNGQTGKYFWKVTVNGVNKEIDTTGSTSRSKAQDEGAKVAAKYPGGKYQTKYYLEGGIADFTGLAWLDGTKERPERILSAKQTEDFNALVSILDDLRNSGITTDLLRDMMNWSTMVSIPSQLSYVGNDAYRGNIANIGDIHVTVQEAQINDDRDLDDLAEIVGQKFVKEISKQGFNIAHYNF